MESMLSVSTRSGAVDDEPEYEFASVRGPVQSFGLERGHRRSAEVGAYGSVSPQFDWGGLIGTIAKTAGPLIAGLL